MQANLLYVYFLYMGIEIKNTHKERIKNPTAIVASSPSSTKKAKTAATIVRIRYPIDHKDRIMRFNQPT